MSLTYCERCLVRIENCHCGSESIPIFGEHRVIELKARRDERKKVLEEVEGIIDENSGFNPTDKTFSSLGNFIDWAFREYRIKLRSKLKEMREDANKTKR